VPTPRPSPVPSRSPITAFAGSPTMIPDSGISWSAFSRAPTILTNIPPTRVPTNSMFSVITPPPTRKQITNAPSSLRSMGQPASPTFFPLSLPTSSPTITPSFSPSFLPTTSPSIAFISPTISPTNSKVESASINKASDGQPVVSNTALGATIGCILLLLIMICLCAFYVNKNSKEKLSPYQVWSAYYSDRNKSPNINNDLQGNLKGNLKEDIHHFYTRSPRPSVNQNTVFTPYVTGRTSFRNSQIVLPNGQQKHSNSNSKRLSISMSNRHPSIHNI